MESYFASDNRVCRERRKRASELQLVPARFHILRHEPVSDNDVFELAYVVPAETDKTVEHGAGREHVYRFRSPFAPDLEPAHAMRQRNTEVDFVKSDMPLVVSVLGLVLASVVVVDLYKVLQKGLFLFAEPSDSVWCYPYVHFCFLLSNFHFSIRIAFGVLCAP